MPDELAEMRDRQDRFDARLTTLEERVKTEAILRAAMDRDISDVKTEQRAQRGLLQAIATTQSDHTRQFSEHGTRLTAIEGRLGNVEGRLGNVEGSATSRAGSATSRPNWPRSRALSATCRSASRPSSPCSTGASAMKKASPDSYRE